MPPLKLRTKLALSYAVLFVFLLGSSGVAVYQLLKIRLKDAADDNLVDHMAGLWGYVTFRDNRPAVVYDAHNPYVAYFLREATRYYQIYDARDGTLLLDSEDSALTQLALAPADVRQLVSHPGIDTKTRNGVPLRFRSAVFQADGHSYLLRVGVIVEHDLADLAELRKVLIALLPIATAIAVLGAWWMAGRTLRPLRDLEQQASSISINQLDRRLPHRGTRDELDSLAATFNQVLSRLDASVHQMRNFADFMAHELRTPMTVLRGEVEVELMRRDLPREWREHLESHLEEFAKLDRQINRFLLVARAETGGINLQRASINLSETLATLAGDMEPLAHSYGISLVVAGDTDVEISADLEWIERAFVNLLDNALKFTPSGGRVEIATRREPGRVTIEVRDTGRGISASDLPRIFGHSYRAADSEAQHRTPGGFGLALTKWVIEEHDGSIRATSEPGNGSVFAIILPSPVPASLARRNNDERLVKTS